MTNHSAHRKFYDFSCGETTFEKHKGREVNPEDLIKYVADNVIGKDTVFLSPFGPRKVVYCDYIASGRSLKFIEDFITDEVLPQYGSTHTTSTVTALQTTLFRHEARDMIRNATQASEHDRVLFVGNGATGAIQKLIHSLRITESPVVIVDPFSHHSSLLPWREIGAKIIRIRESPCGDIDINHLEETLKAHEGRGQIIGCFTAASNVSGIILDDIKITMMLHKYGALAFWDYATAAPYVHMKMNPVVSNDSSGFAHKDAVFFSMHKFLGGVQTPGVLIAKKHLFENPVPEVCGGGTVFFVSRDTHRYLQDIETREEGGTPAVVEAIRAGLVMQLKDNITAEYIMNRNNLLTRKLAKITNDIPELVPLGSMNFENRLPVLSFVVRHATSGLFLHHNFISAVLNDLYGIQSRGGCACAGPYAQDLLGINEDLAQRYEKLLVEDIRLDRSHLRRHQEHSDVEILRPGFVRLNLPYSASDKQIEFILDALQEVCTRGWSLLPQYNFNPETGEWKHYTNLVFKERQWLQNISYSSGMFSYGKKDKLDEIPCYSECLQNAKVVIEQAAKAAQRRHIPDETILFNNEAAELRWFMLPSEGKFYLQQQLPTSLGIKKSLCLPPFTPPTYPLSEDQLKQRLDFVWERKTTPINRTSMAGILQRTATTSCSVSESCSEKMLDDIYDPNDTVVKIHDRINVSNDTVVKSDQNVLHSSDDVSKLAVLNIDEKTRVLTESTQKLTSGKGKLTDTELKNECFNKSKVKTVICEDLKCFVKRNVSKPCQKFAEYHKWYSPPKNIFNSAVEALQEYDMIKHNDRVLVCLSGGKDSLSLLHVLRQYQYYAKARGIYFTLGAVTVDPMSASYDPRPLIPYLSSLGVPYIFEQQDILKQAAELENLNSICSFCSRMKRGRIYASARREGYNVLAFGQHLDDLAESFFMSVFHNGRLRTMKAHYIVKEEDLRVIRPFIYVREKELRIFAESKKLPVIPENCPACFEAPKERHRVKQMLAQQEVLFPGLFWSLRTALHPVMSISATGLENEMFGKSSKFCSQIKNGKLIDNIDDDDDADS